MTALLTEAPATGRSDFLAFLEARPDHERWELIDGRAVMQASATLIHALIAGNVDRLLNGALDAEGSPWVAIQNAMIDLTASTPGNLYVPDVMVVDTRTIEPLQNTAEICLVAVEIVSPSDERRIGRGGPKQIDVKLDRYRAFAVCEAVLTVRQDVMQASLSLRRRDGWSEEIVAEPDAPLVIPPVGLRCTLRDLYARTPLVRGA